MCKSGYRKVLPKQATKAQSVSRGIALLFLQPRRLDGVGGQHHAPAALPPVDPVPIVQKAEWTPGPVWTRAENLAPTGIRSPDRPARSESLNRLSYPGPLGTANIILIFFTYKSL